MRQVISKGVVLIVAVLCVTSMALPAAGANGTTNTADSTTQPPQQAVELGTEYQTQSETTSSEAESSSDDRRVTEHLYVNLDTDEVYRFGDVPKLSELPDGTYLEKRTIQTENETQTKTRRVKIQNGQLGELATTSEYQLALRHDHSEYDVSYEEGSTVDLWISAANGTSPVGDVDVNVTIRKPDGTEETFQKTIDSDGQTTLSYDTTGKDAGRYSVTVEAPNGRTDWNEFIVGPQIKEIYPGIGTTTTVGSDVTAAVLVTENATPIANTETSVTIEAPDGSEEVRSVTTNEDGFAYLNFTAEQVGDYRVDADNFHQYFAITVGTYTAQTRVNGEEYGGDARPGATFNFAGQLRADTASVDSVPVTVEMVRDPYGDEEVVNTYSLTTDSNGIFYVEDKVPEDAADGTEYEFRYSVDGNATIAGDTADLRVEAADSGSSTPKTLEIDIEPGQDVAVPGQTIEFDISATVYDNGSSPYANKQLTLHPTIGFDQHSIGEALTVQTNESGEATLTYTVPEIPDGADIELEAGWPEEFDGNRVSTTYYRLQVQEYTSQAYWESPSESGGEAQYHVSVTDVETGEPITDFPVMVAAERSEGRASVYAAETIYTNSSGSATASITVPADASGENHLGTFARYEDSGGFPVIDVPAFDAEITGLDSYEYAAGETVTATYDGPTGTTAVLAVRSYSDTAPTPIETARVDAGDEFSFTIPSDVSQGTYYYVTGFAMNADGETTGLPWNSIRVEGSTGNIAPTAAFDYSPGEPTTSENVSFDASSSIDDDGTITNYEWDLTGDGTVDATGETVTYQYDSAGSYDVTLTVTDDSGATDSVTKSVSVTEPSSEGVTPAIEPANVSVSPNGTTTVDLTIEGASDIGAYDFDLSISGASGVEISDVALKGDPGEQDVTVADDGRSASADAALANLDASDGAAIATVELVGRNSGEATLGATINVLGDTAGNGYNLTTSTVTTAVTVEAGPGDVTGSGNAATDPDGDGVYEDINGDGSANVLDVQSLFGNLDSDSVQGNPAFDMNGDGSVDILDVQALFSQL